jgi:predicted ester cyclase
MDILANAAASKALEVASKYLDSWNDHDIDAMMDLFLPGGTFSTPAFAMPLSGDTMRAYIGSLLSSIPDMKATLVSAGTVDTDTHAARYVVTGTWTMPATVGPLAGMPPPGKSIRLDAADFLELENGKIAACI